MSSPSSAAVIALSIAGPSGDPAAAALCEELLWTLDDTLSVEARYEGPIDQEAVVGLIAYFSDTSEPDVVCDRVTALLRDAADFDSSLAGWTTGAPARIDPEDWAHAWKRFWKTTRVTPTLIIRPSWEPYEAQPGETVITLDPGCAFGTGAHDTTRLMLAELESLGRDRPLESRRVLDVGCGSGVLAITAALLGARETWAVDIDPLALAATRENAERNGVVDRVRVCAEALDALPLAPPFDVMLVNIQAPTILALLPAMRARLATGGLLIASGLIASSVESVLSAMSAHGLTQTQTRQRGDWFLAVGTLPA